MNMHAFTSWSYLILCTRARTHTFAWGLEGCISWPRIKVKLNPSSSNCLTDSNKVITMWYFYWSPQWNSLFTLLPLGRSECGGHLHMERPLSCHTVSGESLICSRAGQERRVHYRLLPVCLRREARLKSLLLRISSKGNSQYKTQSFWR